MKMKVNYIQRFGSYCTVNMLDLGFENQLMLYKEIPVLLYDPYKTHCVDKM